MNFDALYDTRPHRPAPKPEPANRAQAARDAIQATARKCAAAPTSDALAQKVRAALENIQTRKD